MSPPVVRIAANATVAKLHDADEACKLEVHRLLSYRVSGSEHMAAFQGGHWDGRSSFFSFNEGMFPAGFIHLVTAGLRKKGYRVQLVRAPLPEPLGPERPVIDEFGYADSRYDYQPLCVDKLVQHGQVTIRVATGGGKSRICRIALARINRQALFLTTRSILMYQMHAELEKVAGPVAVLGDGEWGIPYTKPDGSEGRKLSKFNVGMVQTLAQRLRDPAWKEKTMAVLARFEFVILEEAHEAGSDSFWEVMAACTAARYRMALTATPYMKEDEEANMRLLGCAGPIVMDVSEKQLIDCGILARPYFKFVKLPVEHKPKKLYKSTPFAGAYKYGIVENVYRNKMVVVHALQGLQYGMTVLVLVQRQAHGKILLEMLTQAGVSASFIFGENSQKERQKAINRLKNGDINVLIGSTILDVGVDVPAIDMIINAGGMKAEGNTRQRIGRGLREKKGGRPNVAFMVDFADDHNTHLRSHAKERRNIVEQTPGFAEGIVERFDFEALGFRKAAA